MIDFPVGGEVKGLRSSHKGLFADQNFIQFMDMPFGQGPKQFPNRSGDLQTFFKAG